ncbi:thioredoxin-like protein [Fimicolochytrium jonesii]|uniref:thioredoxin-like protein n=1 Tax=Fimicolochytrium jonesii TaxID=1396493 RepID=UPI0022FE8C18|nr:thioredoxin-like protein [Fimicolochytrium jonesii]KAI8825201.1 thioredoxin-like protein [Fimicolochytrium jonesii]
MSSEDTEWNDALRAQGIIEPKEAEITEEQIEEMMDKVIRNKFGEKAIEDRTLDELDELEDEEDDRILESYRRQRMAEMNEAARKEKYGSVIQISKTDYQVEVTEASKNTWVVLHLFQNHVSACKLVNGILDRLAQKYRATKFLKIVADQCIPNYPDRNTPTLLIYGEGDLKRNIVGISQMGGAATTVNFMENMLKQIGAIEDSALTAQRSEGDSDDEGMGGSGFNIRRATKQDEESDDDWD